jgi:hypothetical protein
MADASLIPGERVVDLSASLRFAALVSGGISSAISLWIIKQNILWAAAALVIGAVAGLCIGLVVGPFIFPAPAGQVTVVKVGSESLGATLKAGLFGAVIAGAIAATVPAGIFAQTSKFVMLLVVGCSIGTVIGGVLGFLASK